MDPFSSAEHPMHQYLSDRAQWIQEIVAWFSDSSRDLASKALENKRPDETGKQLADAGMESGIRMMDRMDELQWRWIESVCSGDCEPNLAIDQENWDMCQELLRLSNRFAEQVAWRQRRGQSLRCASEFAVRLQAFSDDHHNHARPIKPLRRISREVVQRLASATVDMSRYDD